MGAIKGICFATSALSGVKMINIKILWCSPSGIHSAEAPTHLGASKCRDGRTKATWCLELQGKENRGRQSVKHLIGAADGSKPGLPALLL